MSRGVKRGVLLVLFIAALVFLYRVRAVLLPFAFALVIVFVTEPFVTRLQKRSVPRSAAIILTYIMLGVLGTFLVYFVYPFLASELNEVIEDLPKHTERLEGLTKDANRLLRKTALPAALKDFFIEAGNRGKAFLERFANRLVELTIVMFSQLISLVVAPVIAFYIMRDWSSFREQALKLAPVKRREELLQMGREVSMGLAGFVRGQLIVSAFVGTLITVGLLFLQVKFALLIGIMAGFFDIVPYFGPFIGATPAVLLAFLDSPVKALWVILLFLIVNQVEGALISPHFLGKNAGIHPVVVIFALLAGGELFGILGMLLAVPVATVLKVVLTHTLRWLRE